MRTVSPARTKVGVGQDLQHRICPRYQQIQHGAGAAIPVPDEFAPQEVGGYLAPTGG